MRPALIFAVLLAASTAVAGDNDDPPVDPLAGGGTGNVGGIEKLGKYIETEAMGLRINTDPVMRQIVCRVAFRAFTASALRRAMYISEEKTEKAIETLKSMELVRIKLTRGEKLVLPANQEAGKMMRSWADKWCASDDKCGVLK